MTDENTEIPEEKKQEIPATEEPPPETPTSEPVPEPEAEPATGTDPFSKIGTALLDAKPEENPHYSGVLAEKIERKNAEKELEASGGDWRLQKDSNGHYWDPNVCTGKVDPKTGLPEKGAKGAWKLRKGVKAAERKKLKKTAPKIEELDSVVEDQAALNEQRQHEEIMQRSVVRAAGFVKGYRTLLAQYSSEKAVRDIFDFPIGAGDIKVTPAQIWENSLVSVLAKHGGGPEIAPEIIAVGGGAALGGATLLHPSQEKRRATLKEKIGVFWYRLKNRGKKKPEKNQEAKTEQSREGGENERG